MSFVDLFNIRGSYSPQLRKYSLSLSIPRPEKVWQLFERNSAYSGSARLDDALVDQLEQFFASGDFVEMYLQAEDAELDTNICDAIIDYQESKNANIDLLGVWSINRNKREIEIVWDVPKWMQDIEKADFEGIYNVLRDWYVNSCFFAESKY